ncbi:unnamed protein product [Orchesella dallaii]|uniref:Uncharacterized protein n=1 Tax=Orchesella dallaii TaxID=48710 RepID=A0ABP1Q301_9HEXA
MDCECSSLAKNMARSLGKSKSETDFELNDDIGNELLLKEAKIIWKSQFQHIVEFTEQLLPMALYEPMKWCHVSICDCMKHVAKTEEIIRNMENDTLSVFQQQLKHWERRQQSCISKSRIPYSMPLYRQTSDILYCILLQNTELPSEVRERIECAFKSQFGKSRLAHARLLVKFCVRQYSQIEDFLSVFPEIIRSDSLAGLISSYFNSMVTNEREVVVCKINDLLTSPDYHENQLCLMLLTRDDCEFKHAILECLNKYMITDPAESSKADTEFSTRVEGDASNTTTTRHRFKLILEAELELLVIACVATEHFSTTLLSIILSGLDIISEKVTTKRAKVYEDFRPPLFGDNQELSLPVEYLRLMKRLKEVPSSSSMLEKAMKSLKESKKYCTNEEFWIELFILLNENCIHGFR